MSHLHLITFLRTPSSGEANFNKTGVRNLARRFWSWSSVSASPSRKKTRSKSTEKLMTKFYDQCLHIEYIYLNILSKVVRLHVRGT